MGLSWKRFKHLALALSLLSLSILSYSQLGEREQQEVRSDIQRALEALKANDPDTAVREFWAALHLDPKNVDARTNLGVIEFMQGHYDEAAEDLRKALKLRPSVWKVQALLGMCEKRLGHQSSARIWLERSFPHLQELNLRIQVGLDLVELDYQTGEIGKAVSLINTLSQLDSKNVDVLYAAYRAYSDMARSALDRIALVAPDSSHMHRIMAEHLINEGDLTSAIVQYKKALQLDPYMPGAHFELGEALLQESRSKQSREEAEKHFKAELALNPSDAKSECRLGDLYQSNVNMDIDAAYKGYARALQLQPNYAEAQLGMGNVLARMGRQQEAVNHLLKATRLDPTNSNAHYRLAQLYRRLGRIADADRETALFDDLEESKKRIREAYREMHQLQHERPLLDSDMPQ